MFINIFDIMVRAGMKDPRVDKGFRDYLRAELDKLDNINATAPTAQISTGEGTPVEVARKIRSSFKAVKKSNSSAEKYIALAYLMEKEAQLNVEKILELSPKEVSLLTELPLK
jgi:hypothetical protein